MLKKFFALLFALLFVGAIPAKGAEAVYINTETELAALSLRVMSGDSMEGVEVYLTSDLTMTEPFIPIGNADTPFCGAFNGGGHTVKGLRVERAEGYNGLFGCIVGGSVKGLSVEDAVILGGDYCGIIAGRIYCYGGYSSIVDCRATGTVEGACYVGGIAGLALSAAHGVYAEVLVSSCDFSGTVKGDIYVGGICGKAEAISTASRAESRVENSESRGKAEALGKYGTMVGGICGAIGAKSNGGSSIAAVNKCLSYLNSVAEKAAAGGICGAVGSEGYGAQAWVDSSVAFGSVGALALAGGVAGRCEMTDRGVSAVKGSVAGGNVVGSDIYPVAKGEGVENCFSSQDGDIVYPIEAEVPDYGRGDLNGDGKTDNLDAVLCLKYDSGLAIPGVAAKRSADVNGDGVADNLDAALILRYDAGLNEL